MALLDIQCTDCGDVAEIVRRAVEFGTPMPPCVACGGPVEIICLPPRTTWRAEAVVVYKAPDGTFRYPGTTNGVATKMYAKMGYERVELRSAAEVRHFERAVNTQLGSDEARKVEGRHANRLAQESHTRPELFRRMKTMSNFGRDLGHAAVARGNARPQERSQGTGFRVEAYSEDRGNRDESRDPRGMRRRD